MLSSRVKEKTSTLACDTPPLALTRFYAVSKQQTAHQKQSIPQSFMHKHPAAKITQNVW